EGRASRSRFDRRGESAEGSASRSRFDRRGESAEGSASRSRFDRRGESEKEDVMDYLRGSSAPLSERVWASLDEAVAQSARHVLAARRVATFDGPHGWDHIGARRGVMRPCHDGSGEATVCVPEVALLSEIRADFSMPWSAVEVFERGAPALDTD